MPGDLPGLGGYAQFIARFAIIQFNTDVDYFKPQLVPVTQENKRLAKSFVDGLEARGGTNISDALATGCHLLAENSERPAYLILMTDGEPTVGETNESKILKNIAPKRDVRIFDFGVGYDVNTRFLNKLAENHHGTSQYVEPNESLEIAVGNFYQKIKSPLLSDVKIDYDGVVTKDVYPRDVKDLFAGSQVMLLGKYKDAGKVTVHLTGKVNGVPKSYSFPLVFQRDETGNTYLPRLWAMRRIGYLTDLAHDNGNNREVIDEIVALSKKYGIITEFTSFLVTDPSENHRLAQGGPTPARFPRDDRHGFRELDASNVAMAKARIPTSAPDAGGRSWFGASGVTFEARHAELELKAAPRQVGDLFFSVTGQMAVRTAKDANKMKDSSYLAKAEAGDASPVKVVDDKTFYLKDGIWIDSQVDEGAMKKARVIVFASKEYFDLVHSAPTIAKYLSVGQQVLLKFQDHIYKVVLGAPKTS